jgi:hypothetical protein
MAIVSSHGVPLGTAPRPSGDAELTRRLIVGLRSGIDDVVVENLLDDAVVARLEGPDILALEVRATGARVSILPGASDADEPSPEDLVEPASVERGMLRSCTVEAHPLTFMGAPVALDLRVANLPIEWITRRDGSLELVDSVAEGIPDAAAVTGDARVRLSHAALSRLVEAVIGLATARQEGVSISELEIEVASAGLDAIALEGTATVSRGRLGARVELAATVRVVDGRGIRVEGLRVGSRHLLAAVLIAAVRGRIEQATADDIDLATALLLPESSVVRASLAADADGVEASLRVR